MSGTLYIVPTPLGNLSDFTPRAVEVLKSVSLVLAEDTRTSAVLFNKFDIKTPCVSHHKYNEHATVANILQRIQSGEDIALVSDAGTPGISDPGFLLSRECRDAEIPVVTLPGPTAFVPALVNSGLPCDRFVFEGFLPQKKGRRTRMEILANDTRTFVIYESPLRVVKTLEQLIEVCSPERKASVSREISKLHEETIRGNLGELLAHFNTNPPRGEFVLVVAGKDDSPQGKIHKNKYRDYDVNDDQE